MEKKGVEMRFISPLPEFVEITLTEMRKNHPQRRARMRAHMVLLSAESYKIGEISKIYKVKGDTVRACFTRWETKGLMGLLDRPRSGRPRILTLQEEDRALELIEKDRRNSKQAHGRLQEETKKKISEWTFKRTLKRSGFRWKRMRRSLKNKQNPESVKAGKKEVSQFQEQEDKGNIALYYFDESGVSTIPAVPYGWQLAGETVKLPSHRSRRLNILGFCNRQNDFYYETVEGWVDSDHVINCFDNFADSLAKPTIVIVDNASMHTSKKFKAKLVEWEKKRLTVHYLPTYSPELNLIEIVWRFLKYSWLPLVAYENYKKLKENLITVLDGIGSKYTITFA